MIGEIKMFRINDEMFLGDSVDSVVNGRRPPHQNPKPKPPKFPKPPRISRRKSNKGLGSKQLKGRKKQGISERIELWSSNRLRAGKIRRIKNIKKNG